MAIKELRRHAGTQFDPELVALFCDLFANDAPIVDPTVVSPRPAVARRQPRRLAADGCVEGRRPPSCRRTRRSRRADAALAGGRCAGITTAGRQRAGRQRAGRQRAGEWAMSPKCVRVESSSLGLASPPLDAGSTRETGRPGRSSGTVNKVLLDRAPHARPGVAQPGQWPGGDAVRACDERIRPEPGKVGVPQRRHVGKARRDLRPVPHQGPAGRPRGPAPDALVGRRPGQAPLEDGGRRRSRRDARRPAEEGLRRGGRRHNLEQQAAALGEGAAASSGQPSAEDPIPEGDEVAA